MDCITHGRYGYIDPAGEHRHGWPHTGARGGFKQCNLRVSQEMGEASRVPREYSYTSGIRCDPDTRKVTINISTKCGVQAGSDARCSRCLLAPPGGCTLLIGDCGAGTAQTRG